VDLLTVRHSEYFTNILCFFCDSKQESFDHLIICPAFQNTWKDITSSAVNYAKTKAKKNWDIDISSTLITKHMNDMSANIYVPKLNRSAWIKGFMPKGFNRIV